MRTATAFRVAMIPALLVSTAIAAQVAARPPLLVRAVSRPAPQDGRTRAPLPGAPADAEPRFQMIDFAFRTGGDDLRQDSVVTAQLTFPDGSTQYCPLHGAPASGAAANISWDNNSTHGAPPCRLRKPRTQGELRQSRMRIALSAPGSGPDFGSLLASGGAAAMAIRSQDNWNIARVDVKVYNADGSAEGCVRSVSGDPVARLTGDQPVVTISDFPNQCR